MRRNKHTEIWKFFENKEDEGIAFCKICGNKFKNNRVSNLKTHLAKLHNIHTLSSVEMSETSSVDSTPKTNPRNEIKIEINKQQFIRSFIGLVTEEGFPLEALNSQNMRNILDPICEGLSTADGKQMCLNSATCEKSLQLVAEDVRVEIKRELRQRFLSLKIDSAAGIGRSIFVINAHFIDDIQIKSHILGIVEFKGGSTTKKFAVEILKILSKYDISLQQVVSLTADNAANMLKASGVLLPDSHEDEGDHENQVYINKIEMEGNPCDMLLDDIPICRCAAHTAQLCALDTTKNPDIMNYILTSRNLTKYATKTSNKHRASIEQRKLKMPLLDCPSKWGSTYTMLENLKAAKGVLTNIEAVRAKNLDENFEINDSYWDFVESYCVVFGPLQKTIKKFQEEQLHYGNFYAQWLKCKILTAKIVREANRSFITTIGNIFLDCFGKYTDKLLQIEILIACLYLDPRFSHILTTTQKINAIEYLKKMWDRIKEVNRDEYAYPTLNSSSNYSSNNFLDVEDEYLNEFLAQGIQANGGSATNVHTKIEKLQLPFLRSDADVLEFWEEKKVSDPELYALSIVCFGVPTTQVTNERAFSTLELLLSDPGNPLSQDTLENIILVKLHPHFLDAAIDTLPLFNDQDDDEDVDRKEKKPKLSNSP